MWTCWTRDMCQPDVWEESPSITSKTLVFSTAPHPVSGQVLMLYPKILRDFPPLFTSTDILIDRAASTVLY